MLTRLFIHGLGVWSAARAAGWCLLLAGLLAGCTEQAPPKPEPPKPRYPVQPLRAVPEYLRGTVYELVDSGNKDPYLVSGYGLVVGLMQTGDNRGVPIGVRNFMVTQLSRHGFGSINRELGDITPDRVLADPSTAIVEVYGFIPPGARRGQVVDVFVQAATGSGTRSLARGRLYLTDMYRDGVDPLTPFGKLNVYMRAQGPLTVNPGALADPAGGAGARFALTRATILGGGVCAEDRPLFLRLRQPQVSTSRTIEYVLNNSFSDLTVARAQDEGLIHLLVPARYNGDWEHFLGVAMHTYLAGGEPGFAPVKARQLAAEAVKPDAPLLNISYALEALRAEALPFIRPLYAHADLEVAYAAARAGWCIGDLTAADALLAIARNPASRFRTEAVRALGFAGASTRVDRMLTELLAVDSAPVRIEAYKLLAAHGAPVVFTRPAGDFVVDRVLADGPPLIYASQSGSPRIALFGRSTEVPLPVMLSAMDDHLTISTDPEARMLVIFNRTDPRNPEGQMIASRPDLLELALRLGSGATPSARLSYADVVGILQRLSATRQVAASFVLDTNRAFADEVDSAPPIVEPDGSAPRTPSPTGMPGETTAGNIDARPPAR
jgi:hypothetical protein